MTAAAVRRQKSNDPRAARSVDRRSLPPRHFLMTIKRAAGMRLALLGPPGSGKGTQAQRICEAFDLVHLASGDILRRSAASRTSLGNQIRDFIDNGMLVPDDLMVELMKQKILSLKKGFV